MSKFRVGDRVRLVSVTNVDAERDDPNRVITDPNHPDATDWHGNVLIGCTGVITQTFCDYYDVAVRFDHLAASDFEPAFVEADLELVES